MQCFDSLKNDSANFSVEHHQDFKKAAFMNKARQQNLDNEFQSSVKR